ncbi:MAG: hypothetical protein WBA74_21510 [Cyclobacteriaceae bacterium]
MKKIFAYLGVCFLICLSLTSCQPTDDLEELYIEQPVKENDSGNTGENTGGGGSLNPPPATS